MENAPKMKKESVSGWLCYWRVPAPWQVLLFDTEGKTSGALARNISTIGTNCADAVTHVRPLYPGINSSHVA
jgi:hypothetical protein